MKSIKCVNSNGIAAVFTYDHDSTEYFLVSLDGVYSIRNTINTTKNATSDGSNYSGEGLEQRNIVITANIIRNYRENRDILSRVFKVHSEGTFYHTEEGETRKIEYRVESIDFSETGVIRPVTISLICPDPYFKDSEVTNIDMSSWEDDFEMEFELSEDGIEFGIRKKDEIKVVDNDSTTDVGIILTIIADGEVINPAILNVTTGESLKLLCTMLPEDKITITTEQGNINVLLTRNGTEIDYNYTVDEDNEGYIQLQSGRNYINYTAEEGTEYMNVSFKYENSYVMP